MTLILLYLVVLILVGVVLFGVASLVFGRGEQLPPLPRATTATVLPVSGVTGADVEAVRFTQVLRGYKTSEVDWVLDRLGAELDQLRGELAAVRASAGLDRRDRHPPRRRRGTGVTDPAGDDGRTRCDWAASQSVLYRDYHDQEWGRELRGRVALFERMSLEAFQSGLSWLIILRKRDNFRAAFDRFDIETVARYTDRDVTRLMADIGIVRNRAKIEATIANAAADRPRHRPLRPAVVVCAAAAAPDRGPWPTCRRSARSPRPWPRTSKTRLSLRGTHHRIRIDAGHGHGGRPHRVLLGAGGHRRKHR